MAEDFGINLSGSLDFVNWGTNISNSNQGYVLAKLCQEDKEQLINIENKLNELIKKKEYVQVRIHK